MCLLKMEPRVATGLLGLEADQLLISERCEVSGASGDDQSCGAQEAIMEKVLQEQDEVGVQEEVLYRDVLVGATESTRRVVDWVKALGAELRRSAFYRVLTRTTQPSHAVSMVFVSFILLVLWPNIMGPSKVVEESASLHIERPQPSVLVNLAYFGSFAIHFGAQMWMTFVSGLALYFNLPRHTFGRVQEILFPKYFTLGSFFSVITLITFIKIQHTAHPELINATFCNWDPLLLLQLVSLTLCAILELTVCLYLAPPMLRLMHQKYHFEAVETVGQEVGHFSGTDNPKLKRSSHYQNIHRRFRQIHMTTAMANMGALLCTFVHLHFMASRVQLL